jgi:hypothetical protein
MISIRMGVKPRASQRRRNNCFPTLAMEMGSRQIFSVSRAPHPGVSGERGDGERSYGLKMNYYVHVLYIIAGLMVASRAVEPTRLRPRAAYEGHPWLALAPLDGADSRPSALEDPRVRRLASMQEVRGDRRGDPVRSAELALEAVRASGETHGESPLHRDSSSSSSFLFGRLVVEVGFEAVDQGVMEFDRDLTLRQALAESEDRASSLLDRPWRRVVDRIDEAQRSRFRVLVRCEGDGGAQPAQPQVRSDEIVIRRNHRREVVERVRVRGLRRGGDSPFVANAFFAPAVSWLRLASNEPHFGSLAEK